MKSSGCSCGMGRTSRPHPLPLSQRERGAIIHLLLLFKGSEVCQARLLHGCRRGRRPTRGRHAGHPLLHGQLPAGVCPDCRLLRRPVYGRPHAQSVHCLQHLAEVRQAVRLRRSSWGGVRGHGPLRPAGSAAGRRNRAHAAATTRRKTNPTCCLASHGGCCRG